MSTPPLDTLPLTVLNGVGPKLAEKLAKLELNSLQDLLFHLPTRYVDRTRVRRIGELRLHELAVIEARVLDTNIVFGRRRSMAVRVEDDSGALTLRFFHFSAAQKETFAKGRSLRLFGELRPGAAGMEIYHPEYEFAQEGKTFVAEATLTPIYPLTEGLAQARLRKLCQQAIDWLGQHPPAEYLPEAINRHFGVRSLGEALSFLHFPPAEADQASLMQGSHPWQKRLAFEELLAHFLVRQQMRERLQTQTAPMLKLSAQALDTFLATLPYSPTRAQQRAYNQIAGDLARAQPMLRMVQGDVGSGKTLVAAMAALNALHNAYQVAIIAPTEILAEQHLRNFNAWLQPLGYSVDWLVGRQTARQKAKINEALAGGQIQLVVGTHALFQDGVQFARLGLVVIDEQHRFGVQQRLSLRDRSATALVPHQLIMTATPIPRTLAMTHYAELDFSVIDELPPGRTPVTTAVISAKRKAEVIERVREACAQGRQAYWVCPLIEESETLDVANAEACLAELQETLPEYQLDLVHGRLKAREKEACMARFSSGETQLLVATTVIEVGVDVPNASVMIIENAERLGLAQLHQLRGRVGRGTAASHCLLLYGDKLSHLARQRLDILRRSNDGFVIAEKDLELRGPGEFLGTRQAGDLQFRIADQTRDASMFEEVHRVGHDLLQHQPDHAAALVDRWFGQRKRLALA